MSHLVPGFLDPDQAGLEDFDVGLRVTSAHSCPNFPGFVLLDQQLPKRGLRVTSPPKLARKSRAQTPPGAVARGTPAAADDPRHESPVDLSRDEDAPCADTAQDHTPPSSSSGSLQPTDRGGTTSGRTNTVSANSSSPSPSTKRGRRPTVRPLRRFTPARNPAPGVGLLWRADLGHFSRAPKCITKASTGLVKALPPKGARRVHTSDVNAQYLRNLGINFPRGF